jgi:hypothetical protein
MDKITKLEGIQSKGESIQGWFISLFEFNKPVLPLPNLFFTVGAQLMPILGKELYEKLKIIKENL